MTRTPSLSIVLFAALTLACSQPTAQDDSWPVTRAESSGFAETSRYADVVGFLEQIADRSEHIELTTFGYTTEGRTLPLAIVSNLEDNSPAAIRASGRLRVYLQGNIHGGEVCGKEALQHLLRRIAQGEYAEWLDSMVLLVAPIYNADGNERIELDHRPGQDGPLGGMGQRPNAQGLDLNRDHMKAESPEARSLLAMMRAYDPQVNVDLHTTNGTRHAYHLTYSPPLNPNTDPAIDSLLRDRWLPELTDAIRAEHGWEFYYYGNTPFRPEAPQGWYTFDHRPRFNNNYIGLRNRVAILSEAYSYATFEERVLASDAFVVEVLRFAHANGDAIREAIRDADGAALVGTELAVRSTFAQSAEPVDILMGDVEVDRHPYADVRVARRLDTRRTVSMYEYGSFTATETATVPTAYLIPAEHGDVVDLLQAHGVQLQPVAADLVMPLERFRVSAHRLAERDFQAHREATLEGAYEAVEVTVPAGTWWVDTAQPLGRLAFYLLEPRSDDGVANWNMLDEAVTSNGVYPILRVPVSPLP